MTDSIPRILSCGDTALTVDFGNVISITVNRRVRDLADALERAGLPGLIEMVPAYRSLTIHFDPLILSREALKSEVLQRHAMEDTSNMSPARRWRVPVVFGGAFGEDLNACADLAGLPPALFIEAFITPLYQVMMVGFLPGFSYLAGLPETLGRPRRSTPRAKVPAGSVSIGGMQAAVGSVEGPSGWHLLGRTPALPFHGSRDPMFLFEAGDEIRFEPVGVAQWERLSKAAADGAPVVWTDDVGGGS
ncbi:hypothetical protein A8B78_00200 [Jannaschia sp. EhC01]|nr:hypothetical protein A8B78_00200 [Jannaschia sp. EhC01]